MPPVSYATDQVHLKHEQPRSLDRITRNNRYDSANAGGQPACFECIDKIVGMRLD